MIALLVIARQCQHTLYLRLACHNSTNNSLRGSREAGSKLAIIFRKLRWRGELLQLLLSDQSPTGLPASHPPHFPFLCHGGPTSPQIHRQTFVKSPKILCWILVKAGWVNHEKKMIDKTDVNKSWRCPTILSAWILYEAVKMAFRHYWPAMVNPWRFVPVLNKAFLMDSREIAGGETNPFLHSSYY